MNMVENEALEGFAKEIEAKLERAFAGLAG
jgi:hypothetical protein